MAMFFSMVSEIERDLISKRTKEALQTEKANGIKLGRPEPEGPGKNKLDTYRLEIEALLKNGSTKFFFADCYKSTPAGLHIWIKKNQLSKL